MHGTREREVFQTNCIFCYKEILCDKTQDDDGSTEAGKFILFVKRYLWKSGCGCGELDQYVANTILRQKSDAAISDLNCDLCSDCMAIVKSFNHLYHQLKCLELHVNWRIEELRQIMEFADKVPSRVKSICEKRNQEDFQRILDFRRAFKKRFQQISGYLTVELNRLDTEPLASTGSSQNPIMSSSHTSQTSPMTPQGEGSIPGPKDFEDSCCVPGESINTTSEENMTVIIGSVLSQPQPPIKLEPSSRSLEETLGTLDCIKTKTPNSTTKSCNLDSKNLKSEIDQNVPHVLSSSLEISTTQSLTETTRVIMDCEVETNDMFNYKLESSIPTVEVVPPSNSDNEFLENVTLSPTQLEKTVSVSGDMNAELNLDINQTRQLRKLHKCTVCSLTFSNSQRLKAHIESAHNESECSSEYDSNDDDEYKASPAKIPKRSKVDNDELFEENVSSLSDDSNSSHEEKLSEKVKLKVPGKLLVRQSTSIKRSTGSHCKESKLKIKEEVINPDKVEMSEKRSFTCEHCQKCFLQVDRLKFHVASVHRPKKAKVNGNLLITVDGVKISIMDWFNKKGAKFTCRHGDCKETFMSDYELQNHFKLHGEFSCNFCSKICTFAADLAHHELEHSDPSVNTHKSKDSKPSIFKCARCSYQSKHVNRYLDHHLGKHLDGLEMDRPRCPICKAGFTTENHHTFSTLLLHYTTHHDMYGKDPESIHRCGQCSAYFINNLQLDTHVTKVHQERNKFPCADCNAVLSKKSWLVKHRLQVHKKSGELSFACDMDEDCKRRYETQVELDRHKLLKHSKKSSMLMCTQCEKKFLGTSAMRMHMKIHEEKVQVQDKGRRFVCDLCGKAYKQKTNLDAHMMFHAGPDSWKYSCSVCGKKTVSEQKLNEHMRTHTKEKPFVCQVCGEKYAHRHNFKNHMKTKHGIDVAVRKLEDTTLFASTRKGKKLKKV